MSKGRMHAGIRVDAYTATYADHPYLTLRVLGHEGLSFLTPSEARLLATALQESAAEAEQLASR